MEVRRAERRLHDIASNSFQTMLDEARVTRLGTGEVDGGHASMQAEHDHAMRRSRSSPS